MSVSISVFMSVTMNISMNIPHEYSSHLVKDKLIYN